MVTSLTSELVEVVRTAARAMAGFARRNFQATMATKFCDSNPRHTESVFGWNRKAVRRGLEEQKLGKPIRLSDDPRGRPTVETQDPTILTISRQLLAEKTQVDPKFQTSFAFTRMTGESLREALAEQLGIPIARLPAARTLRRVMNRNGFLLKKVRKTMPLKKIKKTNAIFDNVSAAHERANQDPTILRISIDTKAKVKIGPFSRGGKTRKADDRDACDHDFDPEDLMVPCGILEVEAHQLTIGFGNQFTTSDLIADNLEQWWLHRREHYGHIRKLMRERF